MQPTNPHEDIMTEAMVDHSKKLEELNNSSDVQVEALSKIDKGIEELNSTADIIVEATGINHRELMETQKELIRIIQEKEKEDIEIKFEIVGGEAQLIEIENEKND